MSDHLIQITKNIGTWKAWKVPANQRRRGTRSGFTIIELLVVISIIAVLVSVLLPVVSKAREEASHLVCQSQLRGQGIAMNAYAADFKDWYPYASQMASNVGFSGSLQNSNSIMSFNQYYTYLGAIRPMFCPTFNHFYWNGNDKPYQVQKDWTPQGANSSALVYGYCKFAGTAALNGTKPVWDRMRYVNYGNPFRDPNGEDPTWFPSSYSVGYLRVRDAESAMTYYWNGSAVVPGAKLGASGVVLWSEYNQLDWYYTSATAHNRNAPFQGWVIGDNTHGVTGMNEVLADGHARWYSSDKSSDGMLYIWDGQQGTWVVQDGY